MKPSPSVGDSAFSITHGNNQRSKSYRSSHGFQPEQQLQSGFSTNHLRIAQRVSPAQLTCAKGHCNPHEQPWVPQCLISVSDQPANRKKTWLPAQHKRERTTTAAGKASTPLPCFLHKRAEDIRIGEGGIKGRGGRREVGRRQQKGGRKLLFDRKSTNRQQDGSARRDEAGNKESTQTRTVTHTHTDPASGSNVQLKSTRVAKLQVMKTVHTATLHLKSCVVTKEAHSTSTKNNSGNLSSPPNPTC